MNRRQFETYCWDHDWKIEAIEGKIIVSKGNKMFKEVLMVGMMLRDLAHKMKEADYGADEVQGAFPFTLSE